MANKTYVKADLPLGSTIEEAVDLLLLQRAKGWLVSTRFNGVTLYSDTVTIDDAYIQITGKTKSELIGD